MRSSAVIGVGFLRRAVGAGAVTPPFDALGQGLEAAHAGSVDALVARLSKALRGAYALAFASRSLPGAPFGSPGAILIGTDATVIVTFDGEAPRRRRHTQSSGSDRTGPPEHRP